MRKGERHLGTTSGGLQSLLRGNLLTVSEEFVPKIKPSRAVFALQSRSGKGEGKNGEGEMRTRANLRRKKETEGRQ